jgi:hypothetical protein
VKAKYSVVHGVETERDAGAQSMLQGILSKEGDEVQKLGS